MSTIIHAAAPSRALLGATTRPSFVSIIFSLPNGEPLSISESRSALDAATQDGSAFGLLLQHQDHIDVQRLFPQLQSFDPHDLFRAWKLLISPGLCDTSISGCSNLDIEHARQMAACLGLSQALPPTPAPSPVLVSVSGDGISPPAIESRPDPVHPPNPVQVTTMMPPQPVHAVFQNPSGVPSAPEKKRTNSDILLLPVRELAAAGAGPMRYSPPSEAPAPKKPRLEEQHQQLRVAAPGPSVSAPAPPVIIISTNASLYPGAGSNDQTPRRVSFGKTQPMGNSNEVQKAAGVALSQGPTIQKKESYPVYSKHLYVAHASLLAALKANISGTFDERHIYNLTWSIVDALDRAFPNKQEYDKVRQTICLNLQQNKELHAMVLSREILPDRLVQIFSGDGAHKGIVV